MSRRALTVSTRMPAPPRRTELQLVRRATRFGDPSGGLAAVAELRRRLDVLEAAHVDEAIAGRWSWQRVADCLGVTKQAAHARHARRAQRAREGLVVAGRARQAVALARREASRLGSRVVETDHLLLGLLREEQGPIRAVLADCGITYDALVAANGYVSAPREQPSPAVASATRRVLEQSMREAIAKGDARLDVEHLLLAILHEPDGRGQAVIAAQGPSITAVERRLVRALRAQSASSSSAGS